MKTHKLMVLALLGSAMAAQSALAQSPPDAFRPSNLNDPVYVLQRLSQMRPRTALDPAHDAVAQGLAKAKIYRFASADYPGAEASFVWDRNSNVAVGEFYFEGPYYRGFTLTSDNYQILVLPNSLVSIPYGINTADNIVGTYSDASATHGFLYANGIVTNISYGYCVGNIIPFDINDNGEIVGDCQGPLFTDGFSTKDGVNFTQIYYPSSSSTSVYGVNKTGEIVGSWQDFSGNTHGFLLSTGAYTSFDFPLANYTAALGINDSGEIAGYFVDAGNAIHGFILSNGAFAQVDVAGAASTILTRIKNSGQVTGGYMDQSNELHGLTGH